MTSSHRLPSIVRTTGPEGLVRASRPFVQLVGLDDDELRLEPWTAWLHPEDRAAAQALLAEERGPLRARHRTARGDYQPFDWQLRREGDELYVFGQLDEGAHGARAGTRARHTEEHTEDMLETMALVVESKNPGLKCSILLVDRAESRITVGAGPSLDPEYNRAVEGLEIGPTVGSCGTAAYWKVPVVVEDIASDPLWRNLREVAAKAGVAACWSQPILGTDGEVLGAMALYDTKPGAPAEVQMNGLEIAARMVGLAVERARLETRLRHATKMDALGVLAGGVAHDFNNLLAVVLGNAELALETLPRGAAARPMLGDIVEATESATALCNQMLAYAGRGSQTQETLDCNALIEGLSELLAVTLSKKAALELELSGNLGVVADASQLRQLLMNLITNAAEAIGNREGRVRVTTRARRLGPRELARLAPELAVSPGEYVEIRVRDTGCGMSAETQARIFEPFYTTKVDGRGLGMAAVQGIVQAHRGTLFFESEEDRGTTFTVWLPWVPVDEDQGVSAPAPRPEAREAQVLVVDDEPAVIAVLTKMLEHGGLRVLQARHGEEALELYRAHADVIDCVLLDLNMPKLDGEEVFRELKRLRPDVCVVLSSGFTEREVMQRFEGSGLAGAVQKPVRMNALLARIQAAITRRATEPHHFNPLDSSPPHLEPHPSRDNAISG